MYYLPWFAAIGVTGGLLGALFNGVSLRLNRYRARWPAIKFCGKAMPSPTHRLMEWLAVATVTTCVVVLVPAFFYSKYSRTCAPNLPSDSQYAQIMRECSTLVQVRNEMVQVCTSGGECTNGTREVPLWNERLLHLVGGQCDNPATYNQMSSLFLVRAQQSVTALFSPGAVELFDSPTLLVFLVFYFVLALLTSGIRLGLFFTLLSPSLLSSSTVG
jgi:hypothetical protein